ncbi:uncharacterized protein DS421_15g504960 [Arachis hypogaea]|nr:uncharacterized protein DS421_15g504960 [Arachis hypogaea]
MFSPLRAPPRLAALAVAEERTQGRDCAARWASPPPSRRRLAEEEEEHRASPSRRAPLSPPVLQPFAFRAAVSRDQRRERDHERDVESASRRETLAAAVALCRVPSLLSEQSSSPPSCCSAAAPATAAGVAAGEGSCASVFLAAGSGSVTSGTTAEASGCFCRHRKILPSPESDHRCRLGWLMGLPPNRFGDRRYFGSAVPSVRVALVIARVAGS